MTTTVEDTLKQFGKMVQDRRSLDQLSLRKAAAEIDVSFNVIARLEQGKMPTAESLVKLMLWHPATKDSMQEIMSTLGATSARL